MLYWFYFYYIIELNKQLFITIFLEKLFEITIEFFFNYSAHKDFSKQVKPNKRLFLVNLVVKPTR